MKKAKMALSVGIIAVQLATGIFFFAPPKAQAALASIVVSPGSATVGVGSTQQFNAIGIDQNGMPGDPTGPITWTSSDTNVGTIDNSGLFTALAVGPTTITATNGTVSGTASVMVTASAPVLTTINVTPAAATLDVGQTQQFNAETLDQYGNPISEPVFWMSSDNSVGSIDDMTGIFQAGAAGTTTISAFASDGITNGTADVTVNSVNSVLTSINTAPFNASTFIGGIQHTSAVAFDQNGAVFSGAVITWSSDNTAVATVAVDPLPANGTNATITAVGVGTANISATATDPATGASFSGTVAGQGVIPITVVSLNPPVLTTVNLTPANPTMLVGDTWQFTVATLDQNGAHFPATVTFSSSDPAVATVDPNTGWYSAVAPGTATITATANGTVSGTTLITVQPAAPVLTTINVTPANPAVTVGGNQQMTVDTLDQYGASIPATVTWSSSDTATGVIDSGTGMFTALAAGTTTVTATSGNVTGITVVTVNAAPVVPPKPVLTIINVTPGSAALNIGDTQKMSAQAFDQNGNPIRATMTWSSSDKAVATVDSKGLVSAVGAGQATIKASSGGKSGSAGITVNAPAAPPIVPATNLSILNTGVSKISANSADISWDTSADATGRVVFGTNKKKLSASVSSDTASSHQSVTLSGLRKNKKYYYQITAQLPDGSQQAQSGIMAFRTTKNNSAGLQAVSISVQDISSDSAAIKFSTSADSLASVQYGTKKNRLRITVSDNEAATAHSITLTGLTANTKYFYRVITRLPDGSGRTQSTVHSFRTGG